MSEVFQSIDDEIKSFNFVQARWKEKLEPLESHLRIEMGKLGLS